MKMDQLISAFPANLSDALAIARNTTLKNKFKTFLFVEWVAQELEAN
jgi:hypothetical protein